MCRRRSGTTVGEYCARVTVGGPAPGAACPGEVGRARAWRPGRRRRTRSAGAPPAAMAGSAPAAPCQACTMTSSVPGLRVADTTTRWPGDVVGEQQAPAAGRAADDEPLHPRVGGEPTPRGPARHALPARVVRRRGPRRARRLADAAARRAAGPRGDHPPASGAGGDGGGAPGDHRAPAHRAAAVLDEGGGVGRVALAGEQVLDDGVEVDVERPVRGGEAVRGPGRVVGRDQPARAGRRRGRGRRATGIPSRSATSSGPAPHTDAAPTRARSSGVAARTTASSAVSTGSSSSGVRPRVR